jgi:hypothetical protein
LLIHVFAIFFFLKKKKKRTAGYALLHEEENAVFVFSCFLLVP